MRYLQLALLALVALPPSAAASLDAAVDERDDRVVALTTGAEVVAAPVLSRPDGTLLPSFALVNETASSAVWISVALPPGVYVVSAANATPILVTVEPDPSITVVEQLARAIQNLTRRLASLEVASNASLRSLARDVDALERNATLLAQNLSTIRADARAAKTAAEGVRIPSDLPRRDDLAASAREARAAIDDARQPLLWSLAGLGILLAAQSAGLAFLVRRNLIVAARRDVESTPDAIQPTPIEQKPRPWGFGSEDDPEPSLDLPATPLVASPPNPISSQEQPRAPGPVFVAESARAQSTAAPMGRGEDALGETNAAASGSTTPLGHLEALEPDGRVPSPPQSTEPVPEVAP